MNTFHSLLRMLTVGLVAAGLLASPALAALDASGVAAPAVPGGVVVAAADCYAIGQQQAAQVGGQLAKATPEVRGGQQVCVIVVLVPARDGQRPRRTEIVVPAG